MPRRESQNLKRHGCEGFDERCEAAGKEEQVSDAEMRPRTEAMREAITQAAMSIERKKGSVPGYLQEIVDRVVNYVRTHGIRPDVLVYVTDGYGDAPAKAPPYPVMWVLTSDGTEDFAPWGRKIHLDTP